MKSFIIMMTNECDDDGRDEDSDDDDDDADDADDVIIRRQRHDVVLTVVNVFRALSYPGIKCCCFYPAYYIPM